MTGKRAVELVRTKLASMQGEARVPLMKEHDGRAYFLVKLREDGVDVDNLHKLPFLPWSAFEVTVDLLGELDGTAAKGSAQSSAKLVQQNFP